VVPDVALLSEDALSEDVLSEEVLLEEVPADEALSVEPDVESAVALVEDEVSDVVVVELFVDVALAACAAYARPAPLAAPTTARATVAAPSRRRPRARASIRSSLLCMTSPSLVAVRQHFRGLDGSSRRSAARRRAAR
jgi:hypothetical protein